MAWRRLAGTSLMIFGAAMVAAMTMLAAIVVLNYVEWDNATDALGTVTIIAVPAIAAGLLLILAGRAVYGGWSKWAPVRRVSAWLVHATGVVLTVLLGGLFLYLVGTGAGLRDRPLTISLGTGTMIAVAIAFLGYWMRPRRQDRPD